VTRLRDFPARHNSLNAIRLLLAVCVIVSHSWPLGGFGADPGWGPADLGTLAVAGFFAISGWLITASRLSSELPSYAWRRFLRIYPGFAVCLVVVGFGVAPVGSLLGAGSWSPADGSRYVVANAGLFMSSYDVGGSPVDVPFPGAWNGSLWTLGHEAACYVVLGLLVTVLGRRRWFSAGVVLAWVGSTAMAVGGVAPSVGVLDAAFVGLAPWFFAGATLFVLRNRVPLHGALALGSSAMVLAVLWLQADAVLAALPFGYLILWAGARLPLQAVGRRNDISYGMYIYAFPVQQLLVLLGVAGWGLVPFVAVSIACTVPLAYLSWVAVERPAQRFRRVADRFPVVRSGVWWVRRRPRLAA